MSLHQLFALRINHGYLIQILLAELVYLRYLPRRGRFALRLTLGALLYVPAAIALPNLVASFVSGWFSVTIFLLTLPLCALCFRGRLQTLLGCCISALFTQNLASNLEFLIYLPWAERFSVWGRLCLSAAVLLLTYAVCDRAFARRLPGRLDVGLGAAGSLGMRRFFRGVFDKKKG